MILHAPKEIGALIRERRSKMNLSQHELAGKVGVSRAWIIALEKGKPSVHLRLKSSMSSGVIQQAGPKTKSVLSIPSF